VLRIQGGQAQIRREIEPIDWHVQFGEETKGVCRSDRLGDVATVKTCPWGNKAAAFAVDGALN
jgi:hypothetical protein